MVNSLLRKIAFVAIAASLVLPATHHHRLQAGPPKLATGQKGMVVSVSQPASDVGNAILQRGGNAVDAAVAVAFALAVTWPEAGNIGGGGFMMVQPRPGEPPRCIEYRETAPAASTPDMFTLGESVLTHKASGVPGTVRGLELAHQKYGKLPWRDLVEPAVTLAREGFLIDEGLARSLNGVLQMKTSEPFTELRRVFGKEDGTPWQAGDSLTQPELANTLEHIAEKGSNGFYQGPVADALVAEMQRGQGLITHADLDAYRAQDREAIHTQFRGHDIWGAPPPSSGGTCLVEMLNVLSHFELQKQGRWSPDTVHLLAETMKRAYLDRARFLGDPAFTAIPARITSAEYAQELAASIPRGHATPSAELAPEIPLAGESSSTTHFCVMDAQGMAVSNTYTLEHSFGSRVVVQGAGFLLNNEMGDFNWKVGHTDTTGRIGTRPNLIAPGKRMLSSQCPVIVTRDGQAVLLTGSPGGRTIINTVLCVLLNVFEFEMELPAAVAEPRLHHQWLPDQLRIEHGQEERFQPLVRQLRARGHTVVFTDHQGDAHSIQRDPASGKLLGVADGRRSGGAAGH